MCACARARVCLCVCVCVCLCVCVSLSVSLYVLCRFSLVLDWNETRVPVEIYWFDKEENPALNSNAYKVSVGT